MPQFFDFDMDAVAREAWGNQGPVSRERNIFTYALNLVNVIQISNPTRLSEPTKIYLSDEGSLETTSSRDKQSGAFAIVQALYNREMAEFISEGIGLFDEQGYYAGDVYQAALDELREEQSVHEATGGGGARLGGDPWDGSPSGGSQSRGGSAGGGSGGGPGGASGGTGASTNPPPPGAGTNGTGIASGAGFRAPTFVAGLSNLLAIGAASQRVSGPFEVGQDGDKHHLGEDRDVNPINSLHLNVLTYFYRDNVYDAPLLFEEEVYKNESSPKFITRSHIRYDPRMDHPFVLGNRSGFWRVQGRCHQHYVDIPPGNPPVGPDHVFDPIKPWSTSSPPDIPVGSPNLQIQPGHLFRPQPLGPAWPDMRGTVVDHPVANYNLDKYAPVVARVESYVAAIGDSFDYTSNPGQARYAGGTAPGGVVYLPPELGIEDHVSGFAPSGVDLSTVHHVYIPGVYHASGYPDLETGGIKTGYRWSGDSTGNLIFEMVDSSGVAADSVILTPEGGALLTELGSDLSTPASGYVGLFAKADGLYYILDDGTVVGPLVDSVAGGGAPTGAEYLVSAAHAGLSAERVTTDTATVAWDHSVAAQAKANVPDDAITDGKIRNSAGVSVIGRAANSVGDPGDIVASANDRILRRFADAVDFGQLTVGMAPDNTWTNAKLANMNAWTLKARNNAGAGAPEDVALADLAVEALPASGDFFLMMLADGSLAVVDWNSLPTGSSSLTVEAHTGNDTLTSGESGSVHTNEGAGGTVELTLPAAAAGLHFYFQVRATQSFRIKPGAGDSVEVGGVGGTGSAQAGTVGRTVHFVAMNATEWVAQSSIGGWTVT